MPKYCSFKHCMNSTNDNVYSFHRFPKKPVLRKQWLVNCGLQENELRINSRLCSGHFEKSCFSTTGNKKVLKMGTCPTIFHAVISENQCNVKEDVAVNTEPTSQLKETNTCPITSPLYKRKRTPSPESTLICPATPSPLKRRRISHDHSYFLPDSPRKYRKQLVENQKSNKKNMKVAKQKIKRLQRRIITLSSIIQNLKKQSLISNEASDILKRTISGVPFTLYKRLLKNVKKGTCKEKFPPDLRAFALTLQFYSTKAYNYVRKVFGLSLPHISTIRKWYSSIDGKPGFTTESFKILEIKVNECKEQDKVVYCSLIIDEMSIKKQILYDGRNYSGFVDLGTGVEDDDVPPAREALVFLLVSLDSRWKLPVGYFLINGLNAEEKANLIKEVVIRVTNVQAVIVNITSDGLVTNFKTYELLGACLTLPNVKPYFINPINESKIYIIFDPCHMMKLVRNSFAQMGEFKNGNGEQICWKFIVHLHNLQESEGLRAGNKLKKKHIQWEKQKMKVYLATQTLSNSVADAIQFCNENLKIDYFQSSEATVDFIKKFDKLFDLFNSRNPFAKGYKGPLSLKKDSAPWKSFLCDMQKYILELQDKNGKFLYKTRRHTAYTGFYINCVSIQGIYDNLLSSHLKYLLAYKLSQDHIELFFCAIRSMGGWCNNPTALHFTAAYKRLLSHMEINTSNSNVKQLENISILNVASTVNVKDTDLDVTDMSILKQKNKDMGSKTFNEDKYIQNIHYPTHINLSEYSENIITYIAGFVCRMVKKRLNCIECKNELTDSQTNTSNYKLLLKKNRGGLQIPSQGTIKICKATEIIFRAKLIEFKGKPITDIYFKQITYILVLKKIGTLSFPNLSNHIYDCEVENNHIHKLIKLIVFSYLKIKLYNLGKDYNDNFCKEYIRSKLNRTIIFKNQ